MWTSGTFSLIQTRSVRVRNVRKVSAPGMCQKKCQCPGCEKSSNVRDVTNLNFVSEHSCNDRGNARQETISPFFKLKEILMCILCAPYMTWQSALCLIQRKHSFTLYFTNLYIYIYTRIFNWTNCCRSEDGHNLFCVLFYKVSFCCRNNHESMLIVLIIIKRTLLQSVLQIRDPLLFLTPGSGMEKKSDDILWCTSGSGNPLILWCTSGSGILSTLDPGWKKSDPGSTSRIRNTDCSREHYLYRPMPFPRPCNSCRSQTWNF